MLRYTMINTMILKVLCTMIQRMVYTRHGMEDGIYHTNYDITVLYISDQLSRVSIKTSERTMYHHYIARYIPSSN